MNKRKGKRVTQRKGKGERMEMERRWGGVDTFGRTVNSYFKRKESVGFHPSILVVVENVVAER
jgi:hypothetical protein